jgi:choline dehydrogenase-like flavoprotein
MAKAGRTCRCLRANRTQMDSILPIYGTAHQCGTLRMGGDAASSVVDASCKAHELNNLYVADTSVFVSSAAVNPALTCIANSLRVADTIKARLQ